MTEIVAWVLVALLLGLLLFSLLRRDPVDPDPEPAPSPSTESPEQLIVERMREGVVVVGPSLTPILANEAARSMLGFAPKTLPPTLRSDEIVSLTRRAMAENTALE